MVEVLELVSSCNAAVEGSLAAAAITLLTEQEKPKFNIFTLSYSRRKPREQVMEEVDLEVRLLIRVILWLWSGSKFSGFICIALSSVLYFIMAVLSAAFSGTANEEWIVCHIAKPQERAWHPRMGNSSHLEYAESPIYSSTQERIDKMYNYLHCLSCVVEEDCSPVTYGPYFQQLFIVGTLKKFHVIASSLYLVAFTTLFQPLMNFRECDGLLEMKIKDLHPVATCVRSYYFEFLDFNNGFNGFKNNFAEVQT